jgi:CHAD domain-containing protein
VNSGFPNQTKAGSASLPNDAIEAFAETAERRRAIDFSDLSTIHRTRVAFKKFRYIVESIPLSATGLTKRDLRTLALYQRRMGNIQDLEVIQATITDLIQRQDGLEGLLASFCAYLRRRRTRALLSFRKSADSLFQFWPPRPATERSVSARTSDA